MLLSEIYNFKRGEYKMRMKLQLHNEDLVKKLGKAWRAEDQERLATAQELIQLWNNMDRAKSKSMSTEASKFSTKYVMNELERTIDIELEILNDRFDALVQKKKLK
jgi:hypothetical protein